MGFKTVGEIVLESNPLVFFPTFDEWLFIKQQVDAIEPSFEHLAWLESQKANAALPQIAPPAGWMSTRRDEDEEDGS
jgi:hypothetical protein